MIDISMKSLRSRLESNRVHLGQVARVWSLDREELSEAALMTLLLERTQDSHAARSVWENLSASERLTLFHILGSGNPARQKSIGMKALQKKTKRSAGMVEEAVNNLREHWYLIDEEEVLADSSHTHGLTVLNLEREQRLFPYRECFQSLWQTGQELFKPSADRRTSSLQHLLTDFHGERLHHLASLCHVPTHPGGSRYSSAAFPSISHPAEIQARICEAMIHPLLAFDLLHHIGPPVQQVFLWLCEQRGQATMGDVRAYLGPLSEEQLLSLLHALEDHGLAFDTLTQTGERFLFVPHDLLTVVRDVAREQAEDDQRYALLPALEHTDAPQSQPLLLYDLAIAVGLTFQHTIEPTKSEKLPKRLAAKFRPLLHGRARINSEQEDLFLDQLFRSAKELELLRISSGGADAKRRYLPGAKLEQWATLTLMEQAQLLLRWWLQSSAWYDVSLDGRLISASSSFRSAILDQLRHCERERWYRTEALLHAIWKTMPLFLYDSYRRKWSHETSLRSRREQWMKQEGMACLGLLTSTLSEMGIITFSTTQTDQRGESAVPELFCLTAFGATLLTPLPSGRDAVPAQEPDRVLVVQPSFEVILLQWDAPLLYQLLVFSEIKHLGPVATFMLTQRALLQGLEAGNTVEGILSLLARHHQKPEIPQNVAYTLRDWAKNYTEARLAEVMLIELSTERAEQTLSHVFEGRAATLRKIAPCSFLVSPNGMSFSEVRRLLEKAGVFVRGEPTLSERRSSSRLY